MHLTMHARNGTAQETSPFVAEEMLPIWHALRKLPGVAPIAATRTAAGEPHVTFQADRAGLIAVEALCRAAAETSALYWEVSVYGKTTFGLTGEAGALPADILALAEICEMIAM